MGKWMVSTISPARKIKLFSGPNTRRWPRFDIADVPSVKSICSNAGSEMQIANISRGGALLRSRGRLVPDTNVQLEFVILGGVIQLAGFVLRSSIASPKVIPRYQIAVVFDRPLQILDYQPVLMADTSQASAHELSSCGVFSTDIFDLPSTPIQYGVSAFSAAIASVSVCNEPDAAQCEMLKLNDW
jgi:hypothetical protein